MSYKITDRLNLFLNTSFYQLIGKKGEFFQKLLIQASKTKDLWENSTAVHSTWAYISLILHK